MKNKSFRFFSAPFDSQEHAELAREPASIPPSKVDWPQAHFGTKVQNQFFVTPVSGSNSFPFRGPLSDTFWRKTTRM
jgi:hypothetical protein